MARHLCRRFWKEGLECPFRRMRDHEEDSEEEEKQPQKAARRAEQTNELEDAISDRPRFVPFIGHRDDADSEKRRFERQIQVVPNPEVLKRETKRIAAFKREGGLQSIPFDVLRESGLLAHGPQALGAVLAAIAIMQLLRGMRSTGLGTSSLAVAGAERQSAKALRPLLRPSGPGRTMGRGGLHVNEAARLRGLLFGRRRIRRRPLLDANGVVIPPGGGPK